MGDLRKAAEMALEFVEWLCGDDHSIKPKNSALQTKEALRQALAQPKWVGLTEVDIFEAMDFDDEFEFSRAIEAKLKEKNCG